MPKKVLGKGLNAILADYGSPAGSAAAPERAEDAHTEAELETPAESKGFETRATETNLDFPLAGTAGRIVMNVPLDQIDPNPRQPRRHFDPDRLSDLADSIQQDGVLQPILLIRQGDRYEIVAGERRFRACQAAGRKTVPAILTDIGEPESLKLALVENLQREDLNPIEEARAFQVMIEEFAWTQEDLGGYLGKDRSTISNTLRLLQLPDEVQDRVARGALSAGHVRALINLEPEDCRELARLIEGRRLSVRQAERLAKQRKAPRLRRESSTPSQDALLRSLREGIEAKMGLPVTLRYRGGRGQISVRFSSDRELERIMQVLGVSLDGMR